jgi:hypothetical protein
LHYLLSAATSIPETLPRILEPNSRVKPPFPTPTAKSAAIRRKP